MSLLLRSTPLTIAALLVAMPQPTPGGPPYPPDQALRTFRIVDGFQIERLAAEPLVASPVAIEVDEDGRLFVVEMPGYPLDVSGSGRIVLLEDTDQDGFPDKRVIFADGLRLPTGVMRWKRGVLVTDSPHVWYFEDADGDGRSDVKREVLTGFALSNPQHTTNTPIYGLDNWIYLANEGPVRTTRFGELFGDTGSAVRFADRLNGPRLPPDADGRNVRFRPDTGELEMLAARSQFGQTFDEWGRHFLVTNNRHIYQEVIASKYVSRNPALILPAVTAQLPDYPLPAALYPATENPEHQLLTDVGVMTSASGLTRYLGDLFPPAYRSAAFVAEGAHNLVHAVSLYERGASFAAKRMFDGREFLASTDAWFRPVNLYVGPDGALYVIDYYRKVLEHPEWMDERVARSQDIYAGQDRGRIYRITPNGTSKPSWLGRIRLGRAAAPELVQTLAHPNIWWRRHAQRLLVDRRPAGIGTALASLAATAEPPFGRAHALWTLQILQELDEGTLIQALRDRTPGVRENAIRIAESRLSGSAPLTSALLSLADDPDPKVRFQLLLTLGDLDTSAASALRTKLLFEDVEDEWVQAAALSARRIDVARLVRAAVDRLGHRDTSHGRMLFRRLGTLSAGAGDPSVVRATLRTILAARRPSDDWWRGAILEGIASGLPDDLRRGATLEPEREALADLLFDAASPDVRSGALSVLQGLGLPASAEASGIERRARSIATNSTADHAARAEAVRLLALSNADRHIGLLRTLLSTAEPAPVQIAALRGLTAAPGATHVAMLVDLWERWTPAVRAEAARAFAREPARIAIFLEAVEQKKVRLNEIAWPLRVRMMMVDDDGLRGRARALFSPSGAAAGDIIDRYRPAMTMAGDPARGRDVFGRTCASCHQYRGASGARFGPDLGEVRGRLPLDLISDILQPNRSIADGYELWTIELSGGGTASGIITGETPASITLAMPGGSETTIPRTRIGAMKIAPVSAMPEGLGESIDVQAMADLIAFIKGQP